MIELIATAESVEQAVELLATGVDTLYWRRNIRVAFARIFYTR